MLSFTEKQTVLTTGDPHSSAEDHLEVNICVDNVK